jgi:predicted nucleic acid-binding protein
VLLIDTNIFFAAVFKAHSRHTPVIRWLESIDQFSTCGLTQIGVFRLLLNDAAMHGRPLAPPDAHAVIADFVADSRHAFLASGPVSKQFVGQTSGSKAAFDDYLIQVAAQSNCKLATSDKAVVNRWPEHSTLAPA